MTKRRRKRIVERVKSVLILLLSCSAVYLVMLIQSTVVPSGLLSHPSTGGGGLAAADPAETARPLRMAAVIPAGGSEVQRFGVQYSDADTADLFQQAYTILVEALSSANQPKEVTEAEWRQALAAAPGGDVRETCKALNAAYQGRGGGKPGFCQGSLAEGSFEQVKAFLLKSLLLREKVAEAPTEAG